MCQRGGAPDNILKVQVCATHLGEFWDPKFCRQVLFGRFSLKDKAEVGMINGDKEIITS